MAKCFKAGFLVSNKTEIENRHGCGETIFGVPITHLRPCPSSIISAKAFVLIPDGLLLKQPKPQCLIKRRRYRRVKSLDRATSMHSQCDSAPPVSPNKSVWEQKQQGQRCTP